jgi:hypothetical protein
MIIPSIIILGLLLVTVFVGFRYNWKLSLAIFIPMLYLGYWTVATQVPKYFGYAVPINFAEMENQALMISGYDGGKSIYLLIIEKGVKEPRLVSMPNNAENRAIFNQLTKKIKNGQAAIIKKNNKKGKMGKGEGQSSMGDIEGVEMKDQNILQKEG